MSRAPRHVYEHPTRPNYAMLVKMYEGDSGKATPAVADHVGALEEIADLQS